MSRLKKVIAVVVSIALLASMLLVGCGSKNETSGGDTAAVQSSPSQEEAKETLPPVTLKWYVESTPQNDIDAVLAEANKVIQQKINATLELEMIDWGAWEDKIKLIIASGEDYDICFTSAWSNKFGPNLAKNAFLELDDLLGKYGQGILKTVPEKYWGAVKHNGKIYGVINYQEMFESPGLYAKKDLLDKYNFDFRSVTKLSQIEPFLEMVKKGEPGITPLAMPTYGLPQATDEFSKMYDWIVGPFGIEFGDKDLKVVDNSDSHLSMPVYNLYRSWYQKGYIAKDAAVQKDYTALQKSGKYAVYRANGISPSYDVEMSTSNKYEVVSTAIGSPTVSQGNVTATLTAISRKSKNPERAMMLINMLFEDLYLFNMLAYGIENKHYTKIDANTIELIKDSKYNPGISWELGSKFNAWLLKGADPATIEFKKKMNDEALPAPSLGFVFDVEPVKSEVAQIDNATNEIGPLLNTGSGDPAELAKKLQEKYKAAGGDKVKAELERQLNEWKTGSK